MNLSELGTPSVVEELSLPDILNQMKTKFIEIAPEFTAYVESDPLIKLMEVTAYRELLNILRKSVVSKHEQRLVYAVNCYENRKL